MKLTLSRPDVALLLASLESHENYCKKFKLDVATNETRILRRKLWVALQKELGNDVDEATGTVIR